MLSFVAGKCMEEKFVRFERDDRKQGKVLVAVGGLGAVLRVRQVPNVMVDIRSLDQ